MPRILIQFSRFGPYHYARLRSAAQALQPLGWEVVGLEIAGSDATYAWSQTDGGEWAPEVITAFPGRIHEEISAAELRHALPSHLDRLAPDAMAIAGWGGPDARCCMDWCRRNGVRHLVMSETRAADGRRRWWKEWVKKWLLRSVDGALVGARSHKDYLVSLGVGETSIFHGYNVVDNAYFAKQTAEWREVDLVAPYFLASNRFIERKNLLRLVEAYAQYVAAHADTGSAQVWNLCLLGDGEQKEALLGCCLEHGLRVVEASPWEAARHVDASALNDACDQPAVYFPGFRQIEELPRFYASAGAFVHPALEEPWGLVLNEAMAAGLPILSSTRVGAAEELLAYGENGYGFDPNDVDAMADVMAEMSGLDEHARTVMGNASQRILAERCPTEAFGRGLAQWLDAPTHSQRPSVEPT